ncbi:hypothetical protein TNIN_244751 [Trichonephila inaurata madagascariensis]|uniref:Uncharacterized protein n=1 Tax=Trichonephila inaurata madagascariensis TaxID=2747483 RepID=A0A8X6Y2Q2_9ARAC|nr:hypothetical protein TNIN_244751 [Trichonephila inaurata madagascariensis]
MWYQAQPFKEIIPPSPPHINKELLLENLWTYIMSVLQVIHSLELCNSETPLRVLAASSVKDKLLEKLGIDLQTATKTKNKIIFNPRCFFISIIPILKVWPLNSETHSPKA